MKYHSYIDNKMWTFTSQSICKKSIRCKQIFTIKYNTNGLVKCYQVKHVAKDYVQKEGINYNETFAPIAKMTIIYKIFEFFAIKELKVY